MVKYLFDTNVISDYLSDSFRGEPMDFLESIIDNTPNISIITKIEQLCWKQEDNKVERIIRNFTKDSIVIEINDKIIDLCVQIRKGKKSKHQTPLLPALPLH